MDNYTGITNYSQNEANADSPLMVILRKLKAYFGNATEEKLAQFEELLNENEITEEELDYFKNYWIKTADFFPKPKEILNFVHKNRKSSEPNECRFFICKGDGFVGVIDGGVDKMGRCCACKFGVEAFSKTVGFRFKPELITNKVEYLKHFDDSILTHQNRLEIDTHMQLRAISHSTVKNPVTGQIDTYEATSSIGMESVSNVFSKSRKKSDRMEGEGQNYEPS